MTNRMKNKDAAHFMCFFLGEPANVVNQSDVPRSWRCKTLHFDGENLTAAGKSLPQKFRKRE